MTLKYKWIYVKGEQMLDEDGYVIGNSVTVIDINNVEKIFLEKLSGKELLYSTQLLDPEPESFQRVETMLMIKEPWPDINYQIKANAAERSASNT